MANVDSKEGAKFEPYTWARPGLRNTTIHADTLLHFAEKVHAISFGSEVILQFAERHALDLELRDDTEPPSYFNNSHISALMRMVQINMGMLCSEADHINDWAHEHLTPEGRASNYQAAAHRILNRGEKLPRLDD